MPITLAGALVAFFVLTGGASHASAPEFPSYNVVMTAYNAVPSQTDDSPLYTAIGAYSNPNVVAARSQDMGKELPFGTVIAIEPPATPDNNCGYKEVEGTIGYRVIADTMNVKFKDRIDVLLPEYSQADTLGICQVTIRVVGHVDLTNPANLPKTQSALAASVNAAGLAENK